MNMETFVLYKNGRTGIEAVIKHDQDGNMITMHLEKNVEDLMREDESLEILGIDIAIERIEAIREEKYGGPWLEITKEEYWDMLEVLPPENYTNTGNVTIFRMSEYTEGDYTSHFANVDGFYYSAQRRASDSITELLDELIQQMRAEYKI